MPLRTKPKKSRPVLILGGAGFVGSHIVARFVEGGRPVIVIDGCIDRTFGREENLIPYINKVDFIKARIQDVQDFDKIIGESEYIIDSMGWTSHNQAIQDPFYDLKINVESHLHVIKTLQKSPRKQIIYLGSRGQYGSPGLPEIDESAAMNPADIQGIHKLAAESAYRVYSNLLDFDAVSLRFPNCYGPNQPVEGEDIGLIGSFIRDLLRSKTIKIFGKNRRRQIVYVKDIAEAIFRLCKVPFRGFEAYNYGGPCVLLEKLAGELIAIIGKGKYERREMPRRLMNTDMGNAIMKCEKIKSITGDLPFTELRHSLIETVHYFEREMNPYITHGTKFRELI
jgi:UDP-glucose 4-epimerase